MQTKGEIENGGRISLKGLRIITIIGLVFAACFVGAASAEEWTGWTYKDSQFERFSEEWVEDVQQHIIDYRANMLENGEEWDGMIQCYMLGWDDRIGYALNNGIINEATGEITYDWGFWGNLFGIGVPEKLYHNVQEYENAMNTYGENYSACFISMFPDEIERLERELEEMERQARETGELE